MDLYLQQSQFTKHFQHNIEKVICPIYIKQGEKVIIGCSGGTDSTALLDIMHILARRNCFEIICANLNHNDQPDSNEHAAYVSFLCKYYKIKCIQHSIKIAKIAKNSGLGFEGTARKIRYEFLRKVAKNSNAVKIVLGHNKNDQAETVIGQLFRGAGSGGLAAMKINDKDLLRPLLYIERSQIKKYCLERQLKFLVDYSNLDNNFKRNSIRNELIPFIKENYNSNIINTLVNTSEICKAEFDYLKEIAETIFLKIVSKEKKYEFFIKREKFSSLHLAIQRHLLKILAQNYLQISLPFERIEKLRELCMLGKTSSEIDLINNWTAKVKYFKVLIYKKEKTKNCLNKNVFFKKNISHIKYIPCKFDLPYGHVVEMEILRKNNNHKCKENEIYVDIDKLQFPITIRTKISGDKIKLSYGNKKIKKLFIDFKIPVEKRENIPIIDSNGVILWVAGIKQSINALVDIQTQNVLKITYVNKGNDYV